MIGQEKLGEYCADGFVCQRMCNITCARGAAQAASKGLKHPIVTKTDIVRFNGMVNVKWQQIHYRGFTIQPKLDMGSSPHLTHANLIKTAWVVVRNGCLAMPGATYSKSILEAKAAIDIFIEAGEDADTFWKLMEPYRY